MQLRSHVSSPSPVSSVASKPRLKHRGLVRGDKALFESFSFWAVLAGALLVFNPGWDLSASAWGDGVHLVLCPAGFLKKRVFPEDWACRLRGPAHLGELKERCFGIPFIRSRPNPFSSGQHLCGGKRAQIQLNPPEPCLRNGVKYILFTRVTSVLLSPRLCPHSQLRTWIIGPTLFLKHD